MTVPMTRQGSGADGPRSAARRGAVGAAIRDPGALAGVLRARASRAFAADPDVTAFAARVSVWGRWFIWVVAVAALAHRPGLWFPGDWEFLLVHPPLVALNGLVHHRLHTGRAVTRRWLVALSAMDVALITGTVVIAGHFHFYVYAAYYPALALFAAVFTSFGLCLLWTTVVASVYAGVALGALGLDLDLGQEKALAGRVVAMYAVVAAVSLIGRFERERRRESARRERELQRERIELSQEIHDTAAQNAYVVSMGIERARRLAGDSDEGLASTLAATASVAKAGIWGLRRPIDEGRLFEGRELSRVLHSHAGTFGALAGIRAETAVTGVEPDLPRETRTRLFSIAHNALANTLLHAGATRVEVRLDFGAEGVRLSVADDGAGLPPDYAERGRGFRGMRREAERLGGRLTVESGGPGEGTTVTCEAPYAPPGGGERDG